MLCTQVLNGMTGGAQDAELRRRQRLRGRGRQHRSARHAARRRRQEEAYVASYGRPQTAAGWHFLTGAEIVDRAAGRRARVPLRYDPA
jgi:hypothetical protein